MFENFKKIKVENEEIEAYHDDCSVCGLEMLARKKEIDKIKRSYPKIYAKLSAITFCSKCLEEMQKKDPTFVLFSDKDFEEMKNAIPQE